MRTRMYYHSLISNPKIAGAILIGIMLAALLAVFLLSSKIPQWSSYHQFADTRSFLGIPNFLNVVSNLSFLLVSIWGFIRLRYQWMNNQLRAKEAIVFLVYFIAVLLTCIGSSYYHWSPDNERLVWDRLPITVIFMSLLSLTIMERVNFNLGFRLLIPLILFGIFSVLYWYWTELMHQGDLRLYGLVQFYSILMIVFILFFFPKSYPPLSAYLGMLAFYVLAKIFESADHEVYQFSGSLISGHTFKHLFAAVSTYYMVVILNAHPVNHHD